ncbi:hypothetical protein L1049_009075 [Liquidambar formosana]|uniref:Transposase-associated domain-containing protein n=1 Tax=Liquidambar formosana TaxID=63359 RepID=A0AAP0SAT9_LIQFO
MILDYSRFRSLPLPIHGLGADNKPWSFLIEGSFIERTSWNNYKHTGFTPIESGYRTIGRVGLSRRPKKKKKQQQKKKKKKKKKKKREKPMHRHGGAWCGPSSRLDLRRVKQWEREIRGMPIDKSWMSIADRGKLEWQHGMKAFLEMAFANVASRSNTIQCPCRRCVNVIHKTHDQVKMDLFRHGFDSDYKIWTFHGEDRFTESSNDNVEGVDNETSEERCDDARAYEMINNMIRGENLGSTTIDGDDDLHRPDREEPNENASKFFRLLRDVEQKLYPGCKKLTKLSFVVRLFQLKCLYGWSNKSVDGLLELFMIYKL